ncbi:MAG: hypothetical protein HW387_1585 [Parachlamydiales bacterium]|nr:hypothetical protein [Parachlamydiales bacterium]
MGVAGLEPAEGMPGDLQSACIQRLTTQINTYHSNSKELVLNDLLLSVEKISQV